MGFLVHGDVQDASRSQCMGDIVGWISGPRDDIDLLAVKLLGDGPHANSFLSDACSLSVDTLVV